MHRQALKDNVREHQIIHARLLLAVFIVLIMTVVILCRFFQLQIIDFETYQTKSQANRVLLQRVAPKRGLILDRENRLLAENQPSYLLALIPDRIAQLDDTLYRLKQLGLVDDDNIVDFRKRVKRYRAFEAVPIKFNVTDDVIAKVAANRIRLQGVEVKAHLVRYYPYEEYIAHMLGYVGRINESELSRIDQDNYGATHHMGKIGVEKSYESLLHGQVGYENVEVNARGVVLRTLEREAPIPGENLTLHMDIDIQKLAYQALNGRRGAVVALDANTGGIIAAASAPSFNPNLFVNGISFAAYDSLRENIDLPLFNRVIQAQYPPGSTVKPIMGIAGLDEKVFTEATTVADPGWYQLPNDERYYRDWKREGHADEISFKQAMAQSCDVYYYHLSYELGIKRMHKYFNDFGLGVKTGVDVPNELPGINPSSKWKQSTGRPVWFPGDTLNAGIGQGFMLATPLQLAYATSIIANRGIRIRPSMVASVGGVKTKAYRDKIVKLQDEKIWGIVDAAMQEVVHGLRGTAKSISRELQYKIAGKTGTAQVIGIKQGERYDADAVAERQRDHALFIGYAPANAPEIIVAVLVENGEHGSTTAAPIARTLMDAWMKKLNKVDQTTANKDANNV